ncbi:BTB/POZ domain-containing protein 6-B-like [Mya arenaria]|uniref:BTB/POZ domain-containing protein 6-B-like n=1 Tax=Mya arenaria TaxID=6604 RepID=UPI0022E01507|nr:BTB/POZ domain-containing protein 6-B-like [Mya arenaria]
MSQGRQSLAERISQSRASQIEGGAKENTSRHSSNQTVTKFVSPAPTGPLVPNSSMSNRSRAQSLRTPSADRELLRTLTVSPNQGNAEATPTPDPDVTVNSALKKSHSRRSGPETDATQGTPVSHGSQASQMRQSFITPTCSETGSPNQTWQDGESTRRDSSQSGTESRRTVVRLPTPPNDIRGDSWQSDKNVPEANNYMLKYEVCTDATFLVGEDKEEIRVHKYVLISRSPVLFRSLAKHMLNPDVRIDVPDMKADAFRDVLQYMYTDEFDIHAENAPTMLYAARKFQLKGLSSLCFQFLDAEMHDETVCKIMEQAHIYNENSLYEKCVRFIYINANSVLRKPSFSELCAECVERIIKADDLRAPEEAVFEACMTWANAECRRQKKQPTDEVRRKVLGKLLYLIRFPTMAVTYFTQKVSLGQLLSHDETLSIFQYFHGEEQQLPSRFSRLERNQFPRTLAENTEPVMLDNRRSPAMARVRRFAAVDGQWKQNGPPDSISFSVSQPIVLYGIEVYGAASGKETYKLKILVYDDITREEIRKNDSTIFTNNMRDTYDVFLSRPLRIPPKRVFTVVVCLRGQPTHKGVDGEKTEIVDGVTFEFSESNRSSNGTGVNVGQIPALLFNKTQ